MVPPQLAYSPDARDTQGNRQARCSVRPGMADASPGITGAPEQGEGARDNADLLVVPIFAELAYCVLGEPASACSSRPTSTSSSFQFLAHFSIFQSHEFSFLASTFTHAAWSMLPALPTPLLAYDVSPFTSPIKCPFLQEASLAHQAQVASHLLVPLAPCTWVPNT